MFVEIITKGSRIYITYVVTNKLKQKFIAKLIYKKSCAIKQLMDEVESTMQNIGRTGMKYNAGIWLHTVMFNICITVSKTVFNVDAVVWQNYWIEEVQAAYEKSWYTIEGWILITNLTFVKNSYFREEFLFLAFMI